MSTKWQRGESSLEGIVILLVIITVIILSPKEGPTGPFSSADSSTTLSSSEILIGPGNASYSYQPYEEYITLENRGQKTIDLTGWQLKNGKDKRPYNIGGTLQRFSADIAVLPLLTLEAGEKAVITTGSVGVQSPYKITNFKENICTGYIDALPDYAFTPPLTRNCPRPELEPGFSSLEVKCRNAIKRLNSCETPEFDPRNQRDREAGTCDNCLDGEILSSSCAAFIREHYSYQGCLAYHSGNQNFYGKTWRIFLGRGWEMWAEEYESIELFDSFGRLITSRNY